MSVFSGNQIPLYVQLTEVMRQRIIKGKWEAGTKVPSIDNLMNELDVSRVTVRQAIHQLKNDGLLAPFRGRGTFVTETQVNKKKLLVNTSLDDLVEMYRDDTPDLTNITITDEQPNILEEDGIAAEKYVNMLRVHSRGGEKYNVVSIFIDDVVFQKAPEDFKTKVVLPILTSLPDLTIASAHQSLQISSADFEVARQLEIPVNTPTAEIRRVLCDPKGRVVYIVDATYRGDYIRLDMNLKS